MIVRLVWQKSDVKYLSSIADNRRAKACGWLETQCPPLEPHLNGPGPMTVTEPAPAQELDTQSTSGSSDKLGEAVGNV